jgi:hypothetical protein
MPGWKRGWEHDEGCASAARRHTGRAGPKRRAWLSPAPAGDPVVLDGVTKVPP